MEMARAYSVFANGGYRVEPYYIESIIGPDGTLAYEAQPTYVCPQCLPEQPEGAGEGGMLEATIRPATDETRWGGTNYLNAKVVAPQTITPQNNYIMVDIMSDVVKRGTAARAAQLNRNDLAGKTGTTNDRRDAWFCGFTPQLVATAWVGFDQERSLGPGEQGSRTALPMWLYFMSDALQGVPQQPRTAPPGLVSMRISADTGLAARPGEPNAIFETFMAGHLPAEAMVDSAMENTDSAPEQQSDDSLF